MSDSSQVWQAWQLSKAYRCRPSEIYGIEHPVQQLYFDRAVWAFGTTLEGELEKAGNNAKKPRQAEQARQRVLQKWLGSNTGDRGYRKPPAPTRRA